MDEPSTKLRKFQSFISRSYLFILRFYGVLYASAALRHVTPRCGTTITTKRDGLDFSAEGWALCFDDCLLIMLRAWDAVCFEI